MCALSYDIGEKESSEKVALTNKCAMALYSDGRYNEAATLFVQTMDLSERKHGKEPHETLIIMSNLASTYFSQGR